MFKFETVVVAIGLCAAGANAFGEGSTSISLPSGTNCNELYKIADALDKENQTDFEKQKYRRTMDAYNQCVANQSKNGDNCRNAPADFKKAQGEFSKACGLANLGGRCAEELSKCSGTNKEDGDSSEEDRPRRSSKRDANQPYDPDSVKKMCPAMAGKDLEKLEKELKDQKDKVQKLEKEIPDLEDKANKVMSSTNEKLQKNKQEQADAQKKMAEDLQHLSDEKDGAEKAIMDQITAITAQIAKANDAISQLSVTKMEGQLKLKQTKTQADLNCHASASAQVAKMQTDVLAATNAGSYNRAGFTGMLKNVGLTDRQSWQRTAMKYYKWCLDSKPTVDTKDGANDGYKLLVTQSEKSEGSIREQIRQLQAQQRQLSSPGGCGAAVGAMQGETAICQSVRKGTEKANQAQQTYMTQVQKLNEDYAQTQQQGTREYQSLEKQAYQRKQEISDERKRLDNLQQYLQAKYDKSGGNSQVDGKGLAEAMERMMETQNAAEDLISCMKNDYFIKYKKVDGYCSGNCQTAQSFLKRVGIKDYDPALDDSNPTAIANGDDKLPAGQTPDGHTRVLSSDKSKDGGVKETPAADAD